MFEEEYDRLLASQIREAAGQRFEQLRRDKTAEKRLYCEVLRPVLPNRRWIFEHEIVSLNGVRIYLDFYDPEFKWVVEPEGFTSHAQNITRERYDFEKMRIRTIAAYGYKFIPFSWDDIDKRPDACRRYMYELLGRQTALPDSRFGTLTLYERETIRYGLWMNQPFRMKELCGYMQLGEVTCRKVLKDLIRKGLVVSTKKGEIRLHEFTVTESAREWLF